MKKLLCVLMFGMMFGQTELTTRVYELENINFIDSYELEIDLLDITGHQLDYAYIEFGRLSNFSFEGNNKFLLQSGAFFNTLASGEVASNKTCPSKACLK